MQYITADPHAEGKYKLNQSIMNTEQKKLEISGRIIKVSEIENLVSKAGKDFIKMHFVIDTSAEFNPEVAFQIFGQEKCDAFLKFNKVGDIVTVFFNVSSREWEGKYFHNIDAWRIEKMSGEATEATNEVPATEEDDLPF